MISPDAGNMGVKAVYVWAGLLIPTTVILWLYYPEVSVLNTNVEMMANEVTRRMGALTSSSMNCMSARSQLGSSRILLPCRIRVGRRIRVLCRSRRGGVPSLLKRYI